ncbi:MAG: hypothetical protein VW421_00830, partial [Gammaproteobacteria bacterium]
SDVKELRATIKEIFQALDELQEGRGVIESQISTFKTILSPSNLDSSSREIADVQARLTVAEDRLNSLAKLHNGRHPVIEK